MRYLLAVLLCAVLSVFGIGRIVVGQTSTETTVTTETTETQQTEVQKNDKVTTKKKKENAAALVTEVQKATAYVIKQSEASAKGKAAQLNPKKKAQRPYWLGLKTISTKTDSMKKALSKKDKSFFKLLSETGLAVTEVNNGSKLMQLKDKDVLKGIKALSIAYNELYRNFGKEAIRKKKGGDLTKKESEQLTKMQTQAKTVETKLKSMRTKVAAQKKKNPRLVKQLDKSIKNCSKITSRKDRSVSAYTDLLTLSSYVRNDWRSIGDYTKVWYPSVYSEWSVSNSTIETFVETIDSTYINIDISITDMTILDKEVEVVDVVDTYNVDESETDIKEENSIVNEYSEKDATEENTKEETEATEETETTTEEKDSTTEEKDEKSEETTDETSEEKSDESDTSEEKSYDPSDDSDGDGVTDDKDDDSSKNDDSNSNDDDSNKDESSNDDDPGTNDNSSSNDDSSSSNDDDSNSNDDDSSNEPPPEA